jgi:hypothetical protein
MMLLVALLALDAILHALVLWRFGLSGNGVFVVGTVIYAMLGLAVASGWRSSVWLALVIALIGFSGLALTLGGLDRDPTLDLAILAVDGAVVAACLWRLVSG